MIATRRLPPGFARWNDSWGAPFGDRRLTRRLAGRLVPRSWRPAVLGPFSVQQNNETRIFEYPWAFHAVPIRPGAPVLDVGAGLSGFQFVLARSGARTMAVDPVLGGSGHWGVDVERHRHLNRMHRTDVELAPCRLEDLPCDPGSVQTIYCLSTLEHLPAAEARSLVGRAAELLAPGGHLVLTIDLFLDVAPFTDEPSNDWGTNQDVADVVAASGLTMVHGDPGELNGFADFDPRRILARLPDYLLGSYPALAQTLVLQR